MIIGASSTSEVSFGRLMGTTETSRKAWHGSRRSSDAVD